MKVSLRFIMIISFLLTTLNSTLAQNNCWLTGNPPTYFGPSGSCGVLSNYIPNTNTTPIHYKINFHFFKRTSGPGAYDNVTATDCQNVINGVNYRLFALNPPTLNTNPITPFNPTQPYIDFQFTNIYFHVDNAAFNPYSVCSSYFYNTYGVNTGSEINVFCTESQPGGTGGCGPFGNYVNLDSPNFWSTSSNWPWGPSMLLAHELGHMVGNLRHADLYNSTSCPNGETTPQFSDMNINNLNSVCGWVPAKQDTMSNNLMSYNTCQCYLSPLQIANYHYLVHSGLYTKYTTLCNYNATQNLNITTTQTWLTSRALGGDLIIKQGKTLTIKCSVSIPSGGKVIVEKGAKLVIDGGEITNFCGQLWKGVEVSGSYNQNQNYSGGYAIHQGILQMLNGAVLSNAENAITTGTTDAIGNFDWNSTGGVILADNSFFVNNVRDVQFMYYTNSANKSYFNNCKFNTNSALNSGATPLARVTLYEVQNIKFLGCEFNYNAGSTYPVNSRGHGIFSADASYYVDDACLSGTNPCINLKQSIFSGFDNGIEVSNTNPLRVISVNHARFLNNTLNGAKFSLVNTPVFKNNYIEVGTQSNASGLYLQNCKYYNIQNNTFTNINSIGSTIGIYVNNSQIGAHQIYRNSFSNLYIAIGAMNDNSGASNTTDGLKMNCNDFSANLNTYDIALMGSSPTVMLDQGIVTSDPKTLVRNKYAATCGSQNRFYIDPSSNKAVNHASNSDGFARPTPQPSCSNSLVNITNSGIAFVYSTHCPDNLASGGAGGGGGGGRIVNPNLPSKDLTINTSVNAKLINGNSDFDAQVIMAGRLNKFLLDTTENAKDSVILLLKNNIGKLHDARTQLIFAYINKKNYFEANKIADSLSNTSNTDSKDIGNVQKLLISLHTNNKRFEGIKLDLSKKSYLETYALNPNKKGCFESQSILKYVYKSIFPEDRFVPSHLTTFRFSDAGNFDAISADSFSSETAQIFPNPSNGTINIIFNSQLKEDAVVRINNMLGELVYTGIIKPNVKFEITNANLDNSIYIVHVLKGDKLIQKSKVAVVK